MRTCAYSIYPNSLFHEKLLNRRQNRFIYDRNENEGPFIGDAVFEESRTSEATSQEIEMFNDNLKLIHESKEMIEQHGSKRIALLFQQLVVCFEVPFHFEIGDTIHQGASSKTLIKECGNLSAKVPFNSAHSSTLPCIIAYPQKKWDLWKKNPTAHTKPKGFVYLQGSHYYNCQNATISLIKLVNSADSALDGTKSDINKLRNKSITLLNDAASGLTTPLKALEEYLNIIEKDIQDIINCPKTSEETRTILGIYLDEVRGSLEEFKKGVLCDRLLDLKIDDCTDDKDRLRKTVYHHRFKIIRESQETESVIDKKFAVLRANILGIKRQPPNFCKVFKAKIFSLAKNDNEKRTMARLFNISEEQLKCDLAGKGKTAAEKLINDKKFEKSFNVLMRDIRRRCRNLVRKELMFRSAVSKGLRHYKGWRQIDLVREYNETFVTSINQPMISKIENSREHIDRKLALQLSELYGVDSGLFFPALFTSTDEG